ncbi:Ni/Fe-hydrogenase, b-type cytochrome subunit [Geobacter sp. 60473]|uniref:Ni/Fe-hydrogenase, b-type cytochrome subunit n=1 Tax=Geobacter sp. 60473 TaxID=3080755 RepID=UPI0030C68CFC
MSEHETPEGDIRIELGDPAPFAGEKKRELLVAAALGAPFGTTDPADLALLGAASRKEDLRHYEQTGYAPLDPGLNYSIARVRRAGTAREELIARGGLNSILYLCRADESTRYRAEMEAGERMVHGFRPLAVAHGEPLSEGGEKWTFLGFVPLRATREQSRRVEEPGAFRYVPVWDWQLRFLHWLAVLLIAVLSVTGILMGSGRPAYAGARESSFLFGYLRFIHFAAGWFLLATALIRIAGLFLASNRYQRWDALFPVKPRDLRNLLTVGQNYLFCRFDRGPHYIGHNPLQQVAYTAIYGVGMLALLTGFALYALYAPDHWLFRHLVRIDTLVGVQYVRLAHLLTMWIFLAFIPIHVYLAIRADTVEREGAISSIISGGRWCRRGTSFEDG